MSGADVNVAAQQGRDGGRAAVIGDAGCLHAGHAEELLLGQLHQAAAAGEAVGHGVHLQQIVNAGDAGVLARNHNDGLIGQGRHRDKVVNGVTDLADEGLKGKHADGLLTEGVAVGGCVLELRGSHGAARAAAVLYHHIDAEVLVAGADLGDNAAQAVGGSASIPGAYHRDSAAWIAAGAAASLFGFALISAGRQRQRQRQGQGQCKDFLQVFHRNTSFLLMIFAAQAAG